MAPAHLSRQRCMRAISGGITLTLVLQAVTFFIAEPLRTFAATTDTETAVVSVTVASGIGLACDGDGDGTAGSGETLNLGTITFTGDTGSYASNKQVSCRITTNSQTGYNLGWLVATGTGAVGGRTGTGHLNSNNAGDRIRAIGTGSTNNTYAFPFTSTGSGWGGRVSSTSSGTQIGSLDFGTDTSAEKYAKVATGSSVAIRQKTSVSQPGGDIIRVHFRAYVGGNKVQPTGTYKATVTFTASVQ